MYRWYERRDVPSMDREHRSIAPKAFISCAKHDALDANLAQRRSAHKARLDRDIERCPEQDIVSLWSAMRSAPKLWIFGRTLSQYFINRLELGMPRRLCQ